MKSKFSYTPLKEKERNITLWVMRGSEAIDLKISNFRSNISCFSCSLWLKDGEDWDNRGIKV